MMTSRPTKTTAAGLLLVAACLGLGACSSSDGEVASSSTPTAGEAASASTSPVGSGTGSTSETSAPTGTSSSPTAQSTSSSTTTSSSTSSTSTSGGSRTCPDITFTSGSEDMATNIRTDMPCAATKELISTVAEEHNFVSGPRSFRSGDWSCSVRTRDDTIPVGTYTCGVGEMSVTWEKS